jgi:AraC-like DNA-binding protein
MSDPRDSDESTSWTSQRKHEQLLQTGSDFSLALVAAHTGLAHPSQLCHHFKRLVGVTPRQFRTPARIA